LREPDASLPVVLPEDAPCCVGTSGRVLMDEVVRRSVPMPLRPVGKEFRNWRRIGMAFVAPSGRVRYSAETGAEWAK
jgi:hypothetical protein